MAATFQTLNNQNMKKHIAVILIVLGIVVSFGATKVSQQGKNKSQQSQTESKPIGGFISEDH
ncbi:hypothetical protein BH09BAC3_BH09BAC3_07900 [soil metagenome]